MNRPDSQSSPASEASPARGPLVSRGLRVAAGVIVLATYPLLAMALLWQTDLQRTDTLHVAVSQVVFMTRTFLFHLGLALGAVLLWAVVRRDRRLALVTMLPLAATLVPGWARQSPSQPVNNAGPAVRVMHFNLLRSNRQTDRVLEEVRDVNPDLVVLHEYAPHWHDAVLPVLGPAYAHVRTGARPGSYGWAIYSRFPIVGEPQELVQPDLSHETLVRAELEVHGTRVALYAVHLRPPKDLACARMQRGQLVHLRDLLAQERLPLLVCGDFNFTGAHRMHRALLEIGLVDAHEQAGTGRGTTWPVKSLLRYVPGIRIDHIYLRGGLTCLEAHTGIGAGSDHRPVIAEIAMPAQPDDAP